MSSDRAGQPERPGQDLGPPRRPSATADLVATVSLGLLLWAGPPLVSLFWSQLFPGMPFKAYFLPIEILGVLLPTLVLTVGTRRRSSLRWRGSDPRFVPWAVVGAAGLASLLSYVQTLWEKASGFGPPPHLSELLGIRSAADLALLLAGAVLLPAVAEETAFRGFMLEKLKRYGPYLAIGAQAMLFAAFHQELYGVPTYLGMGVYLGWLSWRSGSIWPAAAAHATNNLLALAQVNGLSEAWWWANAPWLGPLSVVLVVLALRALLRLPAASPTP